MFALLIVLAEDSAQASVVPASAVAHPPQECINSPTVFNAFPPEVVGCIFITSVP